jgi:predicted RND superfamily exporter protein
VLICFGGYLVQRGYRLGIVEAIATTIFIGFACDYCVHVAQVHAAMHRATSIAPDAAQRGGGGGGGGGGGSRGAERLARTLMHAGPSLYGAALTTVGAALPLLFCYVVVFRRMGEFISVCTGFSFAVALTLIAPAICVAADFAGGCRRQPSQPGSADGRGSDTSMRNVPREPRSLPRVLARIAMPTTPFP